MTEIDKERNPYYEFYKHVKRIMNEKGEYTSEQLKARHIRNLIKMYDAKKAQKRKGLQ